MSVHIMKTGFPAHLRRCVMVLMAVFAIGGPPAYAQDAAAGAKLFQRCAICHATTATSPAKLGPNLHDVVGRRAGRQARYRYSAAMAGANFYWDVAHLDEFIARPQQVVKGTKMAFGGIASAKERQNLIAYLRSLKGAVR